MAELQDHNHDIHDDHDDQDQANHNHTIEITDRAAAMQRRISEPPRLLSPGAGKPSCSIFRVPQTLSDVNGKVYNPHIVSVGPYRRNDPNLRMIEEHKWRYLGALIARSESHLSIESLLAAMAELEGRARECYSEHISLTGPDFCEMMVLDAVFVVELFRKTEGLVLCDPDDPIFTMAWIVPFMYRDLLRLENQIPFFVLQRVFDLTIHYSNQKHVGSSSSLSLLALRFFNNTIQRPEDAIKRCLDDIVEPKHLLDLIRKSLIPRTHPEPTRPRNTPSHIIHCVSKLRRAGIRLKEWRAGETNGSFLAVRFCRGVLEMPAITIDDFMTSFLQNVVAFEQCQNGNYCTKHFTTYATLLDCLVNTYRDVEYLSDKNIIENCYGNDGEVARFINNLGRDIAFDIDVCYLADLFDDVHMYYQNSWHVQWAGFKYTYFDTPWSFISALAALILLALTVAQTFYAVLAFYTAKGRS